MVYTHLLQPGLGITCCGKVSGRALQHIVEDSPSRRSCQRAHALVARKGLGGPSAGDQVLHATYGPGKVLVATGPRSARYCVVQWESGSRRSVAASEVSIASG
jgi:hypothetical protein